jgi:hypothetical protein
MRVRRLLASTLCLTIHAIAWAGATPAQTNKDTASNASLRVTVLDQAGAAILTARVSLKPAKGPERALETNRQGEAALASLAPGRYRLRVEAKGFEPYEVAEFELKPGGNSLEVTLKVALIKEEVQVSRDERDKKIDPRGTSFTTILTEEQISQMPDDPEEFAAMLRQMAGPGATIRVNGFIGGKLPPKSQIREIRFRLNPYAAENHESGFVAVDIYTKPGVDVWHGSLNFGFRDRWLNARNFFAPVRGPERYRRAGFTLDGPLWMGHTSLFLYGEGSLAYDSKTVVAALPDGQFNYVVRRPTHKLNLSARVEHMLTKTHTLRAEYQRNASRQDNLGVGNFDLPDRAYTTDVAEHVLRFADTGMFTRRFVNEFRLQARLQDSDSESASQAPAIIVLNAFNSGGAQVQSDRRARELQLDDNVDFAYESHTMRAGVSIQLGGYSSDELRNANGTFIFPSLAAFQSGRPTTFTKRVGDPHVDFTQNHFGWFYQDDIRVRKGVSLSIGLRHEMQTHVGDKNNFAPRVGLAWAPFRSGKTTLRAGAGIFYDWLSDETFEQTLKVNGSTQHDLVVRAPGFPDPFGSGVAGVLPPSRIQKDPAMQMPYIEAASVGVEQQLSLRSHIRAAYFFQRGVHLLRGRNVNAPVPGGGRPDPLSGNVDQIESSANSTLHLFNININKFSRRFTWLINYTLSKTVDEADGPLSLPANNYDLRDERGPSPGDSRHRLFVMANLSIFKKLRLATTFHFNSAAPYNITTGFDDNNDTVSNDRPAGVTRNSARGAAEYDLNTQLSWGFGFGNQKSRPSQVNKRVTRVGSEPDSFGGPMGEAMNKRWRVQFYLQVYNLLNHANLINFTGVQTSQFFGHATAALPGRRVEAGTRFNF